MGESWGGGACGATGGGGERARVVVGSSGARRGWWEGRNSGGGGKRGAPDRGEKQCLIFQIALWTEKFSRLRSYCIALLCFFFILYISSTFIFCICIWN